MSLSKEVEAKLLLIYQADENLIDGIKALEDDLYQRLIKILTTLDMEGGRFKDTARNMSVVAKFSAAVDKELAKGKLTSEASKWISTFDSIDEANGVIFNTLTGEVTTKTVRSLVGSYRQTQVNSIADALTRYPNLNYAISAPLKRSIMQNIVLGTTYREAEATLRNFLAGNKGMGHITRWATQLTRDALNRYDGAAQKKIADDIGLNAFMPVGSLMTTSRPNCIHMISAPDPAIIERPDPKRKGKTIMSREPNRFADIVLPDGGYLMEDIPTIISRCQGGSGWNPNTTPETYLSIRNGYNCNHNFIPYLSADERQSKLVSSTQKNLK